MQSYMVRVLTYRINIVNYNQLDVPLGVYLSPRRGARSVRLNGYHGYVLFNLLEQAERCVVMCVGQICSYLPHYADKILEQNIIMV